MEDQRKSKIHRGTRCLNCEHPLDLSDKYCPECGQLNSTKRLSFDDFFYEFLSGFYAYDSQLRRTLRVMLFSPGKITSEYVKGRRAKYVNPFKFYLSVTIIFFIVYGFIQSFENDEDASRNVREVRDLTTEEREKIRNELRRIPAPVSTNLNPDSLLTIKDSVIPETYIDKYLSQREMDSLNMFTALYKQIELYEQFFKDTEISRPDVALDSLHHARTTYNRWAYKKGINVSEFKEEPGLLMNYFINKLPLIIFFYLPVFALFIWLIYARRPFNYMEHLVFVFHVQTTFFVLLLIALPLNLILSTSFFTTAAMFLFLFYLYKAMRKFYAQGRFKTLVKFIFLNGIFLTLAIVAAIISLLASFAIY